MTRSSIPSEFARDSGPKASVPSVKYARDLFRQKDLFKSNNWTDRCGAMDADEYSTYLRNLTEDLENWNQAKVSKTIDWLKKLPDLPREQAQRSNLPSPDRVPAGRYAVESEDGELRFYRLWRGTRNPNYVSLYVQHGPDESEVPWSPAVGSILRKIAEDPRTAAIRYGHEIGHCCVCGIRLTNTLSRALGIGPVCGGRFYEDEEEWKTMKKETRAAIIEAGGDPNAEEES